MDPALLRRLTCAARGLASGLVLRLDWSAGFAFGLVLALIFVLGFTVRWDLGLGLALSVDFGLGFGPGFALRRGAATALGLVGARVALPVLPLLPGFAAPLIATLSPCSDQQRVRPEELR